MEKQKKSVGSTLLVVLLLIVTIAALVLATFAWARYTSTFQGNTTANVAKWNVTANITNESTWTQEFTHVVDQKLAPGTSGYIPVQINLGSTEVCVYYEVFIESASGNKPLYLKFYRGSGTTTNNVLTVTKENDANKTANVNNSGVSATALNNTKLIDGYLGIEDGSGHTSLSATEYIYWEWPYQSGEVNQTTGVAAGDAQDTQDGINATLTGSQMTLTIRVIATQVDPSTGIAANVTSNRTGVPAYNSTNGLGY